MIEEIKPPSARYRETLDSYESSWYAAGETGSERMEPVAEQKKQQGNDLTEFGATILALMFTKGIKTQKQLAKKIQDPDGNPISATRLNPWIYGIHTAPWWLGEELAEALNLSEEEKMKLAMAHTYGQRKSATIDSS